MNIPSRDRDSHFGLGLQRHSPSKICSLHASIRFLWVLNTEGLEMWFIFTVQAISVPVHNKHMNKYDVLWYNAKECLSSGRAHVVFFFYMPQRHLLAEADSLSQEEQSGDGRSQRPSFAAVEAIDFDLYESIMQLKIYSICLSFMITDDHWWKLMIIDDNCMLKGFCSVVVCILGNRMVVNVTLLKSLKPGCNSISSNTAWPEKICS